MQTAYSYNPGVRHGLKVVETDFANKFSNNKETAVTFAWSFSEDTAGGTGAVIECRLRRSDLTLCRDDDILELSLELERELSESLSLLPSWSWMCSSLVCGINSSSSRVRYSNRRNDGNNKMPKITCNTQQIAQNT